VNELGILEIVGRLLFAALAGAALGWERQAKDKPAGLRTHMLVTLGSAMFVIIGLQLAAEATREGSGMQIELSRIIQGVIGGVGFLGAGAIIQSRGSVQGITTAASVWVVAAIGIASGLGRFGMASACVILGLVILHGLLPLEHWLFPETTDGPPKTNSKDTSDS
jgi:putative Mg2+ transporter-C (MgtC) family protein